ncbi:MAG: hypothetical protein ACPG31_02385 [Planctomycetota bacterium]
MTAAAQKEELHLLEEHLHDAGYQMEPAKGKVIVRWKHQIRAHIHLRDNHYRLVPYSGYLWSWIAAPLLIFCAGFFFVRNIQDLLDPTDIFGPVWLAAGMAILWLGALIHLILLQFRHKAEMRKLRSFLDQKLPGVRQEGSLG